MANKWIFPSGSVRKAIAFLPLDDAYQAAVVDRRWRACATCTIVSYLSSTNMEVRIKACRLIQGLCTDLATLHAAVVADVTIALIKLLQDTKIVNNNSYITIVADTVMYLHNKYMDILNNNDDPYHESAESELLVELPVLVGLKAKRVVHEDTDSDDDEDDEKDEDSDDEGKNNEDVEDIMESSKVESKFSLSVNISNKDDEYNNTIINNNAKEKIIPPLKIICHYPPQFVPCSSLPKISGTEAVTVIQRDDNKRKLMTIGTWYIEGFVESEVDHNKNLGDTVILWYARTIIAGIAGAGHLKKNDEKLCNVLQMGLGAGSIPSFLHSHYSHINSIDVIEWSKHVFLGAKEGFGYSDNDVITTYISEAVEWTSNRAKYLNTLMLENNNTDNKGSNGSSKKEGVDIENLKYNIIIVDIYTEDGMPAGLKDPLFFTRLKMLLKVDTDEKYSVLLINAGNEMEDFDGLIEMLERKFQYVHQFEHPDEENVIIMCSKTNIMLDEGKHWRGNIARDIPETAFRMYLSRTNVEFNSTFISWMDDQSLCARDSRAVNTPQLHLMKTNIYSPTRYDTGKKK
jgi:hypothetical protein